MDATIIKNAIGQGLREGYRQNLLFLSSYNDFISNIREYILTVNVAKQLREYYNWSHKIAIEYPVLFFRRNAFEPFRIEREDMLSMKIVSHELEHGSLKSKIDIAILREEVGRVRTVSGIELKGINSTKKNIVKDARRMSHAMLQVKPSFSNSIESCFCGFLRRFDKDEMMVTESFIKEEVGKELREWADICSSLNNEFPALDFSVVDSEVTSRTLENIPQIHEDSEYSEVANDTGLVGSYVLTIMRK